MAKLYFNYGTMNSGKTIDVLRCAHNYSEVSKKAYLIKPFLDEKGNTKITSRIGLSREVDYLLKNNDNIFKLIKSINNIDVILVDEVQLLTKKHIDQLLKIAVYLDIPVICYGLRTDFRGNLFSASKRLFEVAHEIHEIKSMCHNGCSDKAIFNARIINNEIVKEGNILLIDNDPNVKYIPLCAKCYLEKRIK